MSWTLLKEEEEVGVDPSPKSFCKTVGFACASLRCHILISNEDSCCLIVGGSPHLLRFFEGVGLGVSGVVAIAAGAAVAAASIMYRLLTRWPEMVMDGSEVEEIRHLPCPKVEMKPVISRELIERRELRNEGVKRVSAL